MRSAGRLELPYAACATARRWTFPTGRAAGRCSGEAPDPTEKLSKVVIPSTERLDLLSVHALKARQAQDRKHCIGASDL
jgi:hypothetical protein